MCVVATVLTMFAGDFIGPEGLRDVAAVRQFRVRQRLDSWIIDGPPTPASSLEPLINVGSGLFDVYDKLISQPDLSPYTLARLYQVLGKVTADRSRFVPPTLLKLNNTSGHVRRVAVTGLAEIGAAKDTPPVVALLWDSDPSVPYQAARTLSLIGDDRALVALDIWLARGPWTAKGSGEPISQDLERKLRDGLKARLDRERAAPQKK